MRWVARLALGTVLAALAIVPGSGDEYTSCGNQISAWWKKSGVSVSLPLSGIVAKLLKIAGVPDLTLEWTLTDTLITQLDCTCLPDLPCCSGPNARAFALLNLFQDVSLPVEYFEVKVPPQGNRINVLIGSGVNWRPTQGVGGTDLCGWPGAVELSVRNYTGSLGLRLGVDLPFGVHETSVTLDAKATCQCNPREGCTEEHAPLLTAGPVFVVPEGEVRQFLVSVSDRRGDVWRVDVSGTEAGAMVEELVHDTQGSIVGAKLRIPSSLDRVIVTAIDWCGQTTRLQVPVLSIHRPEITVEQACWSQGSKKRWVYTVLANVTDRDLYAACVERKLHERLRLTAESSGGGRFLFAPPLNVAELEIDCFDPILILDGSYGIPVKLEYSPTGGAIPREVTLRLTATDAWGFSAIWTTTLINGVPWLWKYESFPPASSPIRIPFGSEVRVTLSFRDPDGDWLELRQVRGPGTLFGSVAQGMGAVDGTWSWTAHSRQSYWLVVFECQDYVFPGGPPYEGPARVVFLLEIIQPPRAYDGLAWVNRGATGRTSLYVGDPDSFSHSFAFRPPPGITVQVVGPHEPRDDDGAWGGLFYEIAVAADRTVCPGVYAVPFTVTDPDGLSSSATLYVRVAGNQPPVADPASLEGTATVTITPTGVELSPAVTKAQIEDPDGDEVYVKEYCPAYAANLTLAYGSLNVTYWPRPYDYCRVLREGDPTVDEFAVLLFRGRFGRA